MYLHPRFQSGSTCVASGCYLFDGYADGSSLPIPALSEIEVSLAEGQLFPPIRSRQKPCYWKQVDEAPAADDSAAFALGMPLELSWDLFAPSAPTKAC